MNSVCKKVYFKDVIKEKLEDNTEVEIPCKTFDGSLNLNKHKIMANFSMKYLNLIRRNTNIYFPIISTLKYIQLLDVLKYYMTLYEFIHDCKNNMGIILRKLEIINQEDHINIEKNPIKKNVEYDPYWDNSVFIENVRKRSIRGASLLPRCSRDSSLLCVKLRIEWIPTIKKFISLLEDIEEYLFFKIT